MRSRDLRREVRREKEGNKKPRSNEGGFAGFVFCLPVRIVAHRHLRPSSN